MEEAAPPDHMPRNVGGSTSWGGNGCEGVLFVVPVYGNSGETPPSCYGHNKLSQLLEDDGDSFTAKINNPFAMQRYLASSSMNLRLRSSLFPQPEEGGGTTGAMGDKGQALETVRCHR